MKESPSAIVMPFGGADSRKPARPVLQTIVRFAVLRTFRVHTTYRRANIDILTRGNVIVCANHVSLLDGLLVALTSPVPLIFGVDTSFSRRHRAARLGMAVLTRLGFGSVVPLDSTSPFGLRELAKALERGQSVMLFPEGKISASGLPAEEQPGFVWLAKRSGAPVCRVQIFGAEKSKLFSKAGQHIWPRIHIVY